MQYLRREDQTAFPSIMVLSVVIKLWRTERNVTVAMMMMNVKSLAVILSKYQTQTNIITAQQNNAQEEATHSAGKL